MDKLTQTNLITAAYSFATCYVFGVVLAFYVYLFMAAGFGYADKFKSPFWNYLCWPAEQWLRLTQARGSKGEIIEIRTSEIKS